MRELSYYVLGEVGVYDSETKQVEWESSLAKITVPYSEANFALAKSVAYGGEVVDTEREAVGGDLDGV